MINDLIGSICGYRRLLSNVASFGFAVLIGSGCTIHPSTEDYSGVTSRILARQIRCETRKAGIEAIIDYLSKQTNYPLRLDNNSYNIGLNLADRYKTDKNVLNNFNPSALTGYARDVVRLIYQIGVAYNYDLSMTETNNNSFSINLANIAPINIATVGLSGKQNLQRQNTRTFTITDTVGELISKMDPRYCEGGTYSYNSNNENYTYPLTGHIGISKTLWDFIELSLFDNLSSGALKIDQAGPAQLSEQLEFTTTIDVSSSPRVVFSPAQLIQIAAIDGSFQSVRKDYHKLIMGIFVNKGTKLAAIRGGILGSIGKPPFGLLASAPVKNDAEEGALAVVNQTLALRIFQQKP